MPEHTLHACDFLPLTDGTYRAVTIRNVAELGFKVWAGAIRPSAIGKRAEEIRADDYAYLETVEMFDLLHVWEYFGRREYSALIEDLRHQARSLGAKRAGFLGRRPPLERVQVGAMNLARLLATRVRAAGRRPLQFATKSMAR